MFSRLSKDYVMVGYSKDSIISIGAAMDRNGNDIHISKQKIIASFYKIILGDIEDIDTYKTDITSILFSLLLIYIRKSVKHERDTFVSIAENITIPMMNRALYEQGSTYNALQRPGEIPMIQIMSADAIGKQDLAKVIAMLMISYDMDFQDMIVSREKLEYYIRDKKLLTEKTFISMEDIINASNNYNLK